MMTTFLDGPARGRNLPLHRSPIYLRVVQSVSDGTWDALDQPDDRPRESEAIFAYRLESQSGYVHLNSRDRKGRHTGGTFPSSVYRFIDPQPADDVMRLNLRWRAWANLQHELAAKGATP